MVDIAAVSVVSSAAVALGTLVVNFVGGERQRRHESDLDFERRVWEQKSEALFTVMTVSRSIWVWAGPLTDDNRQTYALNLSRHFDDLSEARGIVDAFASGRCAAELTGLIDAMRDGGVKPGVGKRVDYYMRKTMELDMPVDSQRFGWYRDWSKEAEEQALDGFAPDLDDLRSRAEKVFYAARDSVRRPKD